MTTDLDIYRSAKILVEQHGADALIEAALKADELLDAGDLDGQAVWILAPSWPDPRRSREGERGGSEGVKRA